MVQATQADIERAYQAQVDRDNGMLATPLASAIAIPEFSVDAVFLQALQRGTVNL